MRKLVLVLLLTLTSRVAWAEFARSTTFDDREVCVKERGVWREFGNSLADNCEAKMDRFAIAAQVVTFGCDCGKNRCWNGEHCTSLSDFKKIYEANQEKENKKIAQQRKKRSEQYRALSNERIIALAKTIPDNNNQAQNNNQVQNSKNQPQTVSMGNNLSQFKDKFPKNENVVTQTVNDIRSNPVSPAMEAISQANEKIQHGGFGKIFSLPENNQNQQNQIVPITPVNPATDTIITDVTGVVQGQPVTTNVPTNNVPAVNDPSSGPTPFFIQQQEKAKQNSITLPSDVTTKNKSGSTSDLGLPEIPLPQ